MTNREGSQQIFKLTFLVLIALWITIATLNNITDPNTNINNINNTISMRLLKEASLAEGLIWRVLGLPIFYFFFFFSFCFFFFFFPSFFVFFFFFFFFSLSDLLCASSL
ncbi:hypothetical protein OURE66S_03833 [Oligella ureolytica]